MPSAPSRFPFCAVCAKHTGLLSVLIGSVLLLIAAEDSFAQTFAEIQRLRKREIVVVRFEGNHVLSDPELQSAILTYHSQWYEHFLNWINNGIGAPRQYVDPEIQDADTVRLFGYYRRLGYLDARVSYTLHEDSVSAAEWQTAYNRYRMTDPSGRKEDLPSVSDTVIFHVYEGPSYSIDRFAVEGLEYIAPALSDKVNGETILKRGSPFTEQALQSEARRVETILRENGYPFFSSPRDSSKVVIVDRVHKSVSINLVYHTGPRVRNGPVVVTYDSTLKRRGTLRASVIAHSVKLDSGAWYRYTDLANSERSLGRLGVFETYRVQLDTSAYAGKIDSIREGTELPVSVYLRMQSTRDITPSVFIGSGIVAGFGLGLNDRSLFSGAENVSILTQYQPWPSSQQRVSIGGQIIFPYVDLLGDVPLVLSLNYSNLRVTDLYHEKTIEALAGSNILLSDATATPKLVLSPDVSLEYVDRSNADTSVLKFAPQTSVQFNVPITVNFTADWSNDAMNPSRGSVLYYSFQGATPTIADLFRSKLPSAAFAKDVLQLKTYLDMSRNGASIVALRLSGGLISLTNPGNSDRDIPIERRLFGGGPNSLRGWGTRGILVSNDSSRSPQFGGYSTIEANIEWRYAPFQYTVAITGVQQFLSPMRLAFFVDAGNVWDRALSPTWRSTAVAAGAGIHYNTFIGTIRLDFGLKLYDPDPAVGKSDRPVSPNASGLWLWNRGFKFWDICYPQFALGQAF